MAVSFFLKVLDFYYFFNAIYYWFYRSYFLTWTVDSCSSEVLLMCDGAAPAPSLLSWLLLHWQSCWWALGKGKLGESQRWAGKRWG